LVANIWPVEREGRNSAAPDFGTLLRRYRLDAGLSQEALAERARLSLHGISALERGYRRTPQRETLELLAGALALSAEQRRAFEAAAVRVSLPRRRDGPRVTVGPWPSAGSASLPLALTRFFGRDAELGDIAALAREHRLVTLTGAGGVGKTQTALRVATAMRDAAEGAVCFVSLAPFRDPSLVETAIANALGVQEVPNHCLRETLVAFLKNKTALLVLDNCEHVIVDAAAVADSLLHACPNLRILATSRESLRSAGERTYPLPSLDENDAVALFVDRARAVDPHFTLTEEKRIIVAEICNNLSGIPLAIELAAARVQVMPVQALAKALDDRLHTLIEGERNAPPRHQTMRAAIDWSYELLTGPEQRLFERLSMFEGGCTIDAAGAVCQGDDVAEGDVLSLISSLVSKSLLLVNLEGNEPRYRLLEPFREYARVKLTLRGEEGAVGQRHLLAYLDLARKFVRRDQHYSAYYGHPRDEIGNWRAAVRWALTDRNDVSAGQRLVAEVVYSWGGTTALLGEARRWIPAALDLAGEQTAPEVIAKLKLAEAHLAMHLDNQTLQLASAQKAAAYFREAGDDLDLLRSQTIAGNALFDLGRTDEARVILEEALSIARKLESRWHTVNVLRNLACERRLAGDTVTSRTYLTEASQLLKTLDDQVDIDLTTTDFASLAFDEGDPESAVANLDDLFARGFDPWTPQRIVVLAKLDISEYLIALGRYEDAREHAHEALRAAHDEQLEVYTASALLRLVTIAALRTRGLIREARPKAARILGFVDARLRALGSSFDMAPGPAFAALREEMRAEAVTMLMAEGAAMTEDEAVEAAIAL
jgi:predicted ATPase/DNA-binding XRE family transcriptional regulator